MSTPTPTVLTTTQPRRQWLNYLIVVIVFLVFSAITVAGTYLTQLTTQRDAEVQFVSAAEEAHAVLLGRIREYFAVLNGSQGLFSASDEVNRNEFHRYFDTVGLTNRYPGFSGVLFTQNVTPDQREDFIEAVRKDTLFEPDGYPNFTIKPEGERPEYFVVNFIYPNQTATSSSFGLDLSTNADRGPAIVKARDTGEAIVTQPTRLLTSQSAGFIIFSPLYKFGMPTSTLEQRRAAFVGTTNGVIGSDRFFQNVFVDESLFRNIELTLYDASASGEVQLYHKESRFSLSPDQFKPLKKTFEISVGSRRWVFEANSTVTAFVGQRAIGPLVVFASGLVLTLSLTTTVFFLVTSRQRALGLAEKMTWALNQEKDQAILAKDQTEAILAGIGDGVFAINTREEIMLFNQAAAELTGFTAAEAIGKPYKEIFRFTLETNGQVSERFVQIALSGKNSSMENHTELTRKDGTKLPVADSAAPFRNIKGEVEGAVVVFRDVTKERDVDRMKSEFVSIASHQLKTPLTAMRWFSEMLRDEKAALSEEHQEYVQNIYASNIRLIELVNALLNVSRLESGRIMVDPVPTDMSQLITEVIKELETKMAEKKQKVSLPIAHNLPQITIDPKLIHQVYLNLLSNANKYTPEGGQISLEVKVDGDQLVSAVKDSGYGIPAKDHERVFQKFYRAENILQTKNEGTGLGLYLVKAILEASGGKIWFESEEGKGSTFSFSLPLAGSQPHKGEVSLS